MLSQLRRFALQLWDSPSLEHRQYWLRKTSPDSLPSQLP